MSDKLKSIGFALILCLVCSFMLTAASTRLKPYQTLNIRTDRKKNILKAIGLIDRGKGYDVETIDRMYAKHIFKFTVDKTGTITDKQTKSQTEHDDALPLYLAIDKENKIRSYIIPIETRGLWGKIYGYMALKKDGSTIDGFTVYKHSETPGLGGEIENSWFQKNFVGKKIVDANNNFVSISIAKGKASDQIDKNHLPNYVDGISGATLTGSYLTRGLQKILSEYEPISLRFRQDILQCRMQKDIPWCENEKEK